MKLQPESKKELLRIAGGTAFCTAIMWVLFAALHLVGWVKFDYTVVLGSLVGAAVAIGNLRASASWSRRSSTSRMRSAARQHYSFPTTAGCCCRRCGWWWPSRPPASSPLPVCCRCFSPRVTIYYLQITGKYKPLTPKAEPVDVSVEDDPEPADAQQSAPDEKGGET